MKPTTLNQLKPFADTVAQALLRQGIRPTARKLRWHPSRVRRVHRHILSREFALLLKLLHAVGADVKLIEPDLSKLTPVKMGRPRRFPHLSA